MDKMRMETLDLTQANIEKLATLFPACVTEAQGEDGQLKKAVNFELLRQMLSDVVLEGDEAYEFTWVGKKAAIVEANRPIRKTLRPCPEESVNWDTTENLYIEGDNLEVLKLLQESYLGKVKMIYIDPPYNTGKDVFVYFDQFDMEQADFDTGMSRYDEDGNLNFAQNPENSARFHSAWCSMIYPCLLLARNLLCQNGVIFISIDNHEVDNMLKICDEIFGIANRIACIVNVNNPKGRSDEKNIATAHEYIAVYQKQEAVLSGFAPEENVLRRYNKIDENGNRYRHIDLRKTGDSDRREDRPNMFYYFYYNEQTGQFYPSHDEDGPEGWIKIPPMKDDGTEGRWRVGIETAVERQAILEPVYMSVKKRWTVMERDYLSDELRVKATTAWTYKDLNSERGTEQFVALGFDKEVFPRPKPLGTIMRPLELATQEDDIILDFFSGSATTAHAVMQLNAEDGGHRKFIMVQLPEPCDEKSEAYKAGYPNICEIGKERIRRAAKKIAEENPDKSFDGGFRVFKLDDTNMTDVYYSAGEYSQDMLSLLESNIKPDRTDLDLLFGCLLEWGLPLSMPYTSEQIEGCTVHTYNDGDLIACFDENIPDTVIKEIARRQPLRAVFRDSSFANSPAKINVGEIFKMLAPDTKVKVL
ncbi:MAG: site-specific DNA-methyltransferase [Butyrivibrio sp.]|nr:site-specific DNA-methyltransferase [Butyrivibrio sp.]